MARARATGIVRARSRIAFGDELTLDYQFGHFQIEKFKEAPDVLAAKEFARARRNQGGDQDYILTTAEVRNRPYRARLITISRARARPRARRARAQAILLGSRLFSSIGMRVLFSLVDKDVAPLNAMALILNKVRSCVFALARFAPRGPSRLSRSGTRAHHHACRARARAHHHAWSRAHHHACRARARAHHHAWSRAHHHACRAPTFTLVTIGRTPSRLYMKNRPPLRRLAACTVFRRRVAVRARPDFCVPLYSSSGASPSAPSPPPPASRAPQTSPF